MQNEIPLIVGVLLVAVMTWFSACRIEQDITERSTQALQESSASWADAEVSGRFITVSGISPSEEATEQSVSRLRELWGVLRVRAGATLADIADSNVDTVRQAMSSGGLQWVEVEREDRALRLSGIAEDLETSERANNTAEGLWPFGPVQNDVSIPDTDESRAALNCRTSIYDQIGRTPVEFASGRATISAEGRRVLRTIASVLRTCRTAQVHIEAHSDSSGDAESNQVLSQDRAASVHAYLEARGLDEERLSSVGFGDKRPVATNLTPEGRTQNRRVEFRIRM